MKNLLIVVFALGSISAFARSLIIGGSVALENQGKGVLQIAIEDKATGEYNFCSSTKIGKNLLITAAHCFDDNKNPSVLGISTKIVNRDFEYDGVEVEKIIIHPSYSDQDENFNSPDVALVYVKNNVDFDKVEMRQLDFDFVQDNRPLEYWGFGCQKTTNNTDNYYPIKKSGKNSSQALNVLNRKFGIFTETINENAEIIYSSMILTAGISMSKNVSSLCWGDSGGPVFLNDKLVGINASYLSKDMKEDGSSVAGVTDVNLHVRLSSIKNWIQENINN